MKRLQMAGNKPIALLGGGTGMIGDPSGRSDMRQMMTVETIQHNICLLYTSVTGALEYDLIGELSDEYTE